MQAGSQVIAGALRKAGESEGKDVALCTLALQGLRPGKCSDAAPESSRFFIFVATGLTACVPTLLFKLLVARRLVLLCFCDPASCGQHPRQAF